MTASVERVLTNGARNPARSPRSMASRITSMAVPTSPRSRLTSKKLMDACACPHRFPIDSAMDRPSRPSASASSSFPVKRLRVAELARVSQSIGRLPTSRQNERASSKLFRAAARSPIAV